ncbi:MAG: chromosome segregation protein SMC [Planctomycetes bacterium]|nr:chromosome segregation protein SMC [Planctomycetota bacterium]
MHLDKLELIGFKSFAEKTEFTFETGLTAVVGPNGCGKSNVVDAIRWVLGEQSVKSLRGEEMADVIFKGSNNRKSLGYAEVSLLFSNSQNILPVDFDQVRVTRRLYRTGESEYFLNKSQCRLRDVRELFMGSGVGANTYCVIEQGKVDALLQSNPQDRRIIFEEAAGISKYKSKKRSALLKLERVEQNLLRLSDILAEVQRQMKSLQRQAGKARRYREYTHQLRELKTAFALHRCRLLSNELGIQAEKLRKAEDERGAAEARRAGLDAEASRLTAQALDLDQALIDLEGRKADAQSRAHGCESQIQHSRKRIQEAETDRERIRGEIEKLTARLEEIKFEVVQNSETSERTEVEILENTARFEENQEAVRVLAEEAAQRGRQIQYHRSSVLDVVNERSGYTNERTSLEGHRRLLTTQMDKNRRRHEEVNGELSKLSMMRQGLEGEIRDVAARLESAQARFGGIQEEIRRLQESQISIVERLDQEQKRLTSKESRRELLQDLERRREGMGTGVKQVLSAVQQQPASLQGVVGTVAELFEVDIEYALAIESALAHAAQAIVTEKTEHTLAAIEYLRSGDRGRASFLPLDRLQGGGNGLPDRPDHPSCLGRALDFVRPSGTGNQVLAHLLAHTHLVRDFQAALDLAARWPGPARFVTLEGDVVCASGPVTGGGAVDRLGLISRKSELRQIENEISRLLGLMAELAGERDQTVQRLSALRADLEAVQAEISGHQMKLIEQRTALEAAQRELSNFEQEKEVLASDLKDFQQQLARNTDQCAAIDQLVARTEAREEEIKSALKVLEAGQGEIDGRREALNKAAGDLRAGLATLKEKRDNLRIARLNLTRSLQDQKEQVLVRHADREQCEERIESSSAEIRRLEGELKGLFEELRQREEEILKARNQREALRVEAEKRGAEMQSVSSEIRTLENQIQELRVGERQLQIDMENLIQQARNELDLALPAPAGQEGQEEARDWDAVQQDIRSLEASIRNLGNVYEDAIEEYEVLELRAQSLTTQEQDLLQAKTKLQEIIRRINRTSRRLFETTFQSVRENFQTIFAKLFGGGRADIFLEEGVDILEAGIEVVARPPGKSENTVLSLLSGGEKALCTVALLFAIFRSRPSPFCILDEVDAPLDENNTDRFLNLILEFNRSTQFIMITHNRRTMRVADSIYGITMQEPGVSSKVAVRFEEVEA